MIVPILFIIWGLGHVLILISPIMHTWLVKVMICQVGNIRFTRGWGVTWITIKIEKIIVICHITKEMLKTNRNK